jgi:hypothetical protein
MRKEAKTYDTEDFFVLILAECQINSRRSATAVPLCFRNENRVARGKLTDRQRSARPQGRIGRETLSRLLGETRSGEIGKTQT